MRFGLLILKRNEHRKRTQIRGRPFESEPNEDSRIGIESLPVLFATSPVCRNHHGVALSSRVAPRTGCVARKTCSDQL